jgi:hypothetical protein
MIRISWVPKLPGASIEKKGIVKAERFEETIGKKGTA